jgi:hypothetical protein
MSEIVECEVLNGCLSDRTLKVGPTGAIGLTLPIAKYAPFLSGE